MKKLAHYLTMMALVEARQRPEPCRYRPPPRYRDAGANTVAAPHSLEILDFREAKVVLRSQALGTLGNDKVFCFDIGHSAGKVLK